MVASKPADVFVGVDIGGTFTDAVLLEAGGTPFTSKVLTTHSDYCLGVMEALALALDRGGLSHSRVHRVVHATTLGSNTLLEGTGARTGLVTTSGFRDVLEIGRLRRPSLYDLSWRKLKPLVPRHLRLEVKERTGSDGSVLIEPARAELLEVAERLAAAGVKSVAVCCLNSYVNPANEDVIKEVLREALPSVDVVTSSETLREIKEYERFSTTVVNSYLAPVFRDYVVRLVTQLRAMEIAAPLMMMQSNGGLVSATLAAQQPIRVIESGPAAGVLGASRLSQVMSEARIISLDMGGTTAKASVVENGRPRQSYEYEVGPTGHQGTRLFGGNGYVVRVPAIDIAEIGAGGGSIAWKDVGGVVHVGPRSAGSSPGPACYALGGNEPTVTDANVVLGYLNPGNIADGAIRIDAGRALKALRKLMTAEDTGAREAAWTVHAVACSNMLRAIRAVTTENGIDPGLFKLISFGGCAPLHAAFVARQVGIATVIVPALAGIYSALGLIDADVVYDEVQTVLTSIEKLEADCLNDAFAAAKARLVTRLASDGFDPDHVRYRRLGEFRYRGQGAELTVALDEIAPRAVNLSGILESLFSERYRAAYGRTSDSAASIELVNVRVSADVALAQGIDLHNLCSRLRARLPEARIASRHAYFGPHGSRNVPVLSNRFGLREVDSEGPLIIEDPDTTIVVPPGDSARIDRYGSVIISIGSNAVRGDKVDGRSTR